MEGKLKYMTFADDDDADDGDDDDDYDSQVRVKKIYQ